jgi:NAD(P)-dependent dehydrogenase (short-subunit alcohol dehydrogenase family)
MTAPTKPLVLITGANQGIGLSAARLLASKSFHVIIGARNIEAGEKAAAELQGQGHSATYLQLDLDSQSSIEAAIAKIEKEFGYLDVLVNNAGIFLDHLGLPKHELYTKTFSTNVIGPAVLTEGLIPILRKAKAGPPKIIFVSSAMGSIALSKDKTLPWYNLEAKVYDASKAAVNMLVVNFDRVLNGDGKVFAVCPGKVATSLTGYDGVSLEEGAARIVELAVNGEKEESGTFTHKDGSYPW